MWLTPIKKGNLSNKYYLIIIPIVLVAVGLISTSQKGKGEKLVPLNANVTYYDKKFVVTNNYTIDFIRATITIDEYYKLTGFNLTEGETYTIYQSEFVHQNGIHYPANRNPLKFAIWCETKDNKNGFFSQKFN